jgi:arylsulfatase
MRARGGQKGMRMSGNGAPFSGRLGRTLAESTPDWPPPPRPPDGAPNIYCSTPSASPISAATGRQSQRRRSTGLPTGLALHRLPHHRRVSTTRAALLTGRNHHAVGMGCLANFDNGLPGYRGKIARTTGTLAEMLRPHGYRSYMLGNRRGPHSTRRQRVARRWGASDGEPVTGSQ